MHGRQNLYNSRNLLIKRFFDLLLSIILLILLLPIMIFISVLVKCDSQGPILFKQRRVGRNLKQFSIFKFRTMYNSYDILCDDRSGLLLGDISKSREKYKTTSLNDVRVTKLGKLLRKSHLDELPQLLNVCFGSMSLIGPRPDVPVQEYDYRAKYWITRHTVKPGITGLSQLYICKSNKERLAKDIYYIKNSNMCLDLLILIRTIFKVFKFNSY